jgi:hypothetical protein
MSRPPVEFNDGGMGDGTRTRVSQVIAFYYSIVTDDDRRVFPGSRPKFISRPADFRQPLIWSAASALRRRRVYE